VSTLRLLLFTTIQINYYYENKTIENLEL